MRPTTGRRNPPPTRSGTEGGTPAAQKGSGASVPPEPRGAAARQKEDLITVGFEPTPSRTSALSWRLRPLGQVTIHDRCTSGSFASMRRPPHTDTQQWIRLRLQAGLRLQLRLRRSFTCGSTTALAVMHSPSSNSHRRPFRNAARNQQKMEKVPLQESCALHSL